MNKLIPIHRSVAELKEHLIKKISKLENAEILEDLQRVLDFDQDDSLYFLNEEEIKYISLSEKQISEGKTRSNEEVVNEMNKWFIP